MRASHGFDERLTSYEVHNVFTPQSSILNLILCESNGLGDVQIMKVDHPILPILRQRGFENNLWHISADIHLATNLVPLSKDDLGGFLIKVLLCFLMLNSFLSVCLCGPVISLFLRALSPIVRL